MHVKATKRFFRRLPRGVKVALCAREEALKNWRQAVSRGAEAEAAWEKLFEGYRAQFGEVGGRVLNARRSRANGSLMRRRRFQYSRRTSQLARRNAGGTVMNALSG